MPKNEVAVIGWHEGSAGQIHSWFEDAGLGKIACFIHPDDTPPQIQKIPRAASQFSYPESGMFKGAPFICKTNWPEHLIQQGISRVLVTLPDPAERWPEMEKARKHGFELVNAIHPSTLQLPESILGRNIIIHASCTIGYRAEIDDGVILNTGCQVDHHCKIQRCVTIDPGVTFAGNVLVEEFCTIHTGAVVINRIKIGKNSVLGAGTVVIRDVEAGSKLAGVPARSIARQAASQ